MDEATKGDSLCCRVVRFTVLSHRYMRWCYARQAFMLEASVQL